MDCLERVGWPIRPKPIPHSSAAGCAAAPRSPARSAFDADFLLLDEPFTGLDETLWRGIAAEIRRVYADRLIVLITHIPAEAQAMKAAVLPLPAGAAAWGTALSAVRAEIK